MYSKETKYYRLKSQWHYRYNTKDERYEPPVFTTGDISLVFQVRENLAQFGYTIVFYEGPYRECNTGELQCTYKIQHETPTPHLCECIVCKLTYLPDSKEVATLREEWHSHPLSDCLPKKKYCMFSQTEPVNEEDIPKKV